MYYKYTYVCMHVCTIHIYLYIYICIHTCIYIYRWKNMNTYILIYICIYIYVYIYVFYIYIYTHTYMYICMMQTSQVAVHVYTYTHTCMPTNTDTYLKELTNIPVTRLITTHSAVTCVTWLIDVCYMSHWYVRHNSLICIKWLIHPWVRLLMRTDNNPLGCHLYDKTQWYVGQYSLMCDRTHISMNHAILRVNFKWA